jgi:hypothetical protein
VESTSGNGLTAKLASVASMGTAASDRVKSHVVSEMLAPTRTGPSVVPST